MLRTARFGILALVAACGSRTGLEASGAAGDAGGGVAQCATLPWLLFDVSDQATESTTIYAMHADGTALHRVPLPHGPAEYPSVSPDGTKLLYATFFPADADVDGGVDSALYLYDFASRSATLVVTTSQLSYSALSPDGQTVAYTTGYSLAVIAVDGSGNQELLTGPNNGTGYGHPTFTADSQTIVYGTGGIVGAIGVDGSDNQTLLGAIPGSFFYPNAAFSPDYQELVAGVDCAEDLPLTLAVFSYGTLPGASCTSGRVLADVDDSSSSNLANDPSWGPTGLIAYAADTDVYVIDANGGAPTKVTGKLTGDGGAVSASDPVWAPACAAIP